MKELIIDADAIEINTLHQEVIGHLESAKDKIIRIGEILTIRKSSLRHGEWLPWVKNNLTLSQATVNRYMIIYRDRENTKLLTVSNLADFPLLTDSPKEDPPVAKAIANSKRNKARMAYTKKHGLEEVRKAMENGEISIDASDRISHAPKDQQLTQLALEKVKPKKAKPPQAMSTTASETSEKAKAAIQEITSGTKAAKKVDFQRGDLSEGLKDKGFTTYLNAGGKPCLLSPDVSELEHRERGAVEMGGSDEPKHRKKLYKWNAYRDHKVRERVLKALASLARIDVRATQFAPAFQFTMDLANPEDFEELVTMLCADLHRLVAAQKQIAKYATKK